MNISKCRILNSCGNPCSRVTFKPNAQCTVFRNDEQACEDTFYLGMSGIQGYQTIGSNDTHTQGNKQIQYRCKDSAVY